MEKQEIRNHLIKLLKEQPDKERKKKAEMIWKRVTNLPAWKEANCVALTISQDFEVETRDVIKQAWEEGKKVVVPKCLPKTRKMMFYIITSFSQLEVVYSKLYEPIPSQTKQVEIENIDLVIAPGVAFTARGERLGFGGGYYDRFLANYTKNLLAVAFSFQVLPSLPTDSHDRIIPMIVTEQEVIKLCKMKNLL